ncbi:MAG: response regulator transcription factor [Sphingobacteriales bacterium]|jgi:DNA-binding response OmpR family regulator|nr:response regulator transcription factor [Sphingobacteriales bacterium]NCT74515.1 response regulator transcription factor [Chitinophagaceae bacterium]OJW32441.1 MAG: DNA-binding response regulator [Sphingobacteriales bacterium 46-32]
MQILLVEDEPAVASMLNKGLAEEGHTVTVAPDGRLGLEMATSNNYQVIILDVMLPGLNGIELCRQLRKNENHTPILMLTALGTTDNLVTGLDAGADDYITKPFKFRELSARLRSLSRRGLSAEPERVLRLADLEMNLTARTVERSGQQLSLTATEYRLLEYLMKNKGRVLSRLDLLENVWGIDFNLGTNVVDVYVNYLRKKVERSQFPKLIHTVIGMGYTMKEPAA